MFILLFNVGIILVLCFTENFIFSQLYKNYQIKKLNSIVQNFENGKQDVYVLAEKLAYNNDVCISVVDNNLVSYSYNNLKPGCMLGKGNISIDKKISGFIKGKSKSEYYRIYNSETKSRDVLYGIKLNDKNIFVYSNLGEFSGIVSVVRGQMIYYVLIIILLAIIVSVFLANKITRPIKSITESAKKIGEGNYNVKFPKNGILEIDSLSQTLEDVELELSRNEQVKRDLLANVSHDLKTPLTMIKAYAEMIKDISYKDKEKMCEHLDIIIEESDRLTVLVNDILELSKTQENANMYIYEEYDLVKEIKKIIKRYQVMTELEDYKFLLDLPKKAIIKADKNKINQVIYNLLNNAINYTGDDKVVKIIVKREESSFLVQIVDTGKGIKKDELARIWDKYYKNELLHKRNQVGTGLGLSIVKEILNKHNFSYGVESTLKKGSTFYFRIEL